MLDKVVIKQFYIKSTSGDIVQPVVAEYLSENDAIFTWDSSLVLAAYIASRRGEFEGKRLLELGCGNALAGITAALVGAAHIILTDRVVAESPKMYDIINYNIALNNLNPESVIAKALVWGIPLNSSSCSLTSSEQSVDVILGADVLYMTESIPPLLLTIDQFMKVNPLLQFIMTYQDRNSHRTLLPYLDAYNMSIENIPLSTFIHTVQLIEGRVQYHTVIKDGVLKRKRPRGGDISSSSSMIHDTDVNNISDNKESIHTIPATKDIPLNTFDSIYCYKITRKCSG